MKKTIICKDVFGNKYEENRKDLNLTVGVYAIIIEKGKILLSRQWDGYSLIGGSLELGETVEEVIIREVKEESGLDFEPGEVFYYATTFFKKNATSPARHSVQLYLKHRKISGVLGEGVKFTESEKEYTRDIPEWVELDKIDKIKFRHSVPLEKILKAYKE